MLAQLSKACDQILSWSDFWTVAGLTECSFEVGSARYFARAINWFVKSGLLEPDTLVESLRCGVNGTLTACLKQDPQTPKPVECNRGWRGEIPDISCGCEPASTFTLIENKVLYDAITAKYYGPASDCEGSVAKDALKLRRWRKEGSVGNLYQTLFFLEFPNLDYPSGCWYEPNWQHMSCRERAFLRKGFPGIDAQYRQARLYLSSAPVWGDGDAPKIVSLDKPDKKLCAVIEKWFDLIFRPDERGWRVDVCGNLKDARVGAAIWEY